MGCGSKFIIPSDPDGKVEILERGEAPAAKSPPKEKAPGKGESKKGEPVGSSAPKVAVAAKAAPRTPALNTPPVGRTSAARLVLVTQKKKGSSLGFLLVFAVIAAAAGIGYVKLVEDKDGGDGAGGGEVAEAGGSGEKTPGEEKPPARPVVTPPPVVERGPSNPPADPGDDDGSAPFDPSLAEGGNFELTDEKKARALAFLKSDDLEKREGAYTAFRALGGEHKGPYAELLGQAREHHLALFREKVSNLSAGAGSADFDKVYGAWKAAADAAVGLVQTDWRATAPDDLRAKYAEMETAVGEAEQRYRELVPVLKSSGGQGTDSLQGATVVFGEIADELAWCSGGASPAPPDLRKLIAEVGGPTGTGGGDDKLARARAALAAATATGRHNADINWGTSAYRSFAAQLNARRVALGLGALRLDGGLTAASEVHSGDMLFQNYFAHNGNDGSDFAKRVQGAGFAGKATGECIFKGDGGHEAAYKAWWHRDAYRRIMYSAQADTLGLGNARDYWTLNTGKSGS